MGHPNGDIKMKKIILMLAACAGPALAGGSNYGIVPGALPQVQGKVTEWPVPTPKFARDPAPGPDGNIYIADMQNHSIRKVDAKTGVISTFAGSGKAGYSGDGGPANKAELKQPHSIQFGADGDLYICDIGNHVIRKVDMKTNTISTFAGTGKAGATPDGAPIKGTPLKGPRSLDVDKDGNLWLVTREGNQVFKLDMKSQTIHHIAGTGKAGFNGNGGPAKQADLKGPKGVAIDAEGNAWLADTESHTVRMINAKTGNLELIAGTGEKGDGPDGDPLKCKMARLHGIYVDADGSIFIGDSESHRVRVLRKK